MVLNIMQREPESSLCLLFSTKMLSLAVADQGITRIHFRCNLFIYLLMFVCFFKLYLLVVQP